MDFALPEATAAKLKKYQRLIEDIVRPGCRQWYRHEALPHDVFAAMGAGWGYLAQAILLREGVIVNTNFVEYAVERRGRSALPAPADDYGG